MKSFQGTSTRSINRSDGFTWAMAVALLLRSGAAALSLHAARLVFGATIDLAGRCCGGTARRAGSATIQAGGAAIRASFRRQTAGAVPTTGQAGGAAVGFVTGRAGIAARRAWGAAI